MNTPTQNKRLIFTDQKGNLNFVIPSPNFKGSMEELRHKLTIQDQIDSVDEINIIDIADVPKERVFRNAWKKGSGGKRIDIDLPKAKTIAHGFRRIKRKKELNPLDEEVTMNHANPAKLNVSEAKRQVIRDKYVTIQNNIDACDNVDDLQNIVNAEGLI